MAAVAKRILVVEDDPDNRRIVETLLSLDGYDVQTVGDGITALERVSEWRPDLVLIDLKLPRLDGLETTRRLKARADLRGVPVIAVTALALKGDAERAAGAGCDDYLTKPYAPRALRDKIRRWIGDPR